MAPATKNSTPTTRTRKKRLPGAFSQNKRGELLITERQRLKIIEQRFQDEQHLVLVQGLLNDIAFMTVELEEARQMVKAGGLVEEYQNGENQKGYKKSSAIETYDKLVNSRLRCIKQLTELMPPPVLTAAEGSGISPEDELLAFIAEGGSG